MVLTCKANTIRGLGTDLLHCSILTVLLMHHAKHNEKKCLAKYFTAFDRICSRTWRVVHQVCYPNTSFVWASEYSTRHLFSVSFFAGRAVPRCCKLPDVLAVLHHVALEFLLLCSLDCRGTLDLTRIRIHYETQSQNGNAKK